MSDTMSDLDPQDESHNIKLLREKAAQADEAAARATALERELALTKSGIDVDHPLGEFFVKNYSGEVTDLEAIKAEATKLGVPLRGAPAEPEATAAGETESHEDTGSAERNELGTSDPNPGEVKPDPRQKARDQFDADMERGLTADDAGGRWFSSMVQAAMDGDARVIVEGR